MGNFRKIIWFAGACLVLGAPDLNSAEPLRMKVSPAMVLAPGLLTIQAVIEADADNRLLEVVAESRDFYRSSQIQLNGSDAPRLSVLEFRNLPTGFYHVTGTLIGTRGPRASVLRMAEVHPSPGQR